MAKRILFLSDFPGGYAANWFRSLALDKLKRYWKNKKMKQLSFVDAVKEAVANAISAGNPFSIHDITNSLRTHVNDGSLEFTDRNIEDVDGINTYRVDHQEVRNEFLSLWNAGQIDATRKPNGSFMLYTPDSQSQPVAINHSTTVATNRGNTQNINVQKLKDYLNNALARGEDKIEMKKIQSRFKDVTGVTCEEYADVLENLGYSINNSTASPSKWVVIL